MKRIQLQRARGWRIPYGAVSVARPGRWGNPFSVEKWGRDRAVELYRLMLGGGWSPDWIAGMSDSDASLVAHSMAAWRKRQGTGDAEGLARAELRELDLACWCKPGKACHADVLLEVANR